MNKINAGVIMSAIFGVILVFYLIANTFNDASDEIQAVAETTNVTGTVQTVKGAGFIKLLPLFLAFGVVYFVYKMAMK